VSAPAEDTIQISTPTCDPGIGKLIRVPGSADLIGGVVIRPYDLWPDDRGYFLEVTRMAQGLTAQFPPATTQVSAALSYPGTIKAFHFHKYQTDVWVPVVGLLQVALVDLRPDSATFGSKNTFFVGSLKPWQVLIPPGVGHGYKVVGDRPATLVYVTDRLYDPSDEGRIAYNDRSIAYDWETQHK
jgi:dTDP-4-dehydrorhamnose 3,5-epimerase